MKREQKMEQLVISAMGESNSAQLNELLLLIAKNECMIAESRYASMGNEIVINLLVKGPWNAIAKIESGLSSFTTTFRINFHRTEELKEEANLFPYIVDIVGISTPITIYETINFFIRNNIFIDDFQSTTYEASLTKTTMFSLTMRIGFPSTLSIADFREQFVILCDELNIDGVLAPEKP